MHGFDFTAVTDAQFNDAALTVFNQQASENKIYNEYLKLINCKPSSVNHYTKIPFLPVSFFKNHRVTTGEFSEEIVFTSSGTTGIITSKHFIRETEVYERSFLETFKSFYGEPSKYCILALLPSYLERSGSSLIYMTAELIRRSNQSDSGFYPDKYIDLHKLLSVLRDRKQPTILLGVSFALLDMAEQFPIDFPALIVMETGGMKGRRKEIIRDELHQALTKGFNIEFIHSEYGMTELLSQAYSKGKGIYQSPPWMRVLIRDVNDPFSLLNPGDTGGVNIIDLANYNSCSFIAVQDLGKVYENKTFEILGRFDQSDLRGCNLMVG